MTLIDNRLQVAKMRLAYIVSFLMGNVFIVFAFSKFLDNKTSLIVAIVILLIFVYLLIIKPEYIFIQIKNGKTMLVRTYSAFPLFRKYKSYEISLNVLVGIETKKNIFHTKPFFRFLVKTKQSVGKYPWLSLSIVSKKDFNKLATYLNKTVNIGHKVESLK